VTSDVILRSLPPRTLPTWMWGMVLVSVAHVFYPVVRDVVARLRSRWYASGLDEEESA